ncbi:MAG: hypothetical protein ACPLY7_01050, partial [Microgenomates group bacterium]
MRTKLLSIIVLVLVLAAGAGGFFWTKERLAGGEMKVKGDSSIPASTPTSAPTSQPTPSYPSIIGSFLVTDKEVCTKDGRPLVYFFGSSSCPHCMWEKPIIEKVAKEFVKEIDFHENIDS